MGEEGPPALLAWGQPRDPLQPLCLSPAPQSAPLPPECHPGCCLLQVYEDYDCTLNQTNISANNNKFYIIQLIQHGGAYSTWSRWGRVVSPSCGRPHKGSRARGPPGGWGEPGAPCLLPHLTFPILK